MNNAEFICGLLHEFDNRAFALLAVNRFATRFSNHESAPFWMAYKRLEEYNQPIYTAALRRLGQSARVSITSQIKAWIVSSVPKFLLTQLLRTTLTGTEKYLATLIRLRDGGPDSEIEFLDYMVEQESLQIEMMKEAISGEYANCDARLEKFLGRPSTPA